MRRARRTGRARRRPRSTTGHDVAGLQAARRRAGRPRRRSRAHRPGCAPVAPPSSSTSSMITSSVRPTLAASFAAEMRGGQLHQAGVALFLHLLGHRIGQGIGGCALDRLEAEGADAVELRFVQPVQQILEIGLGLAGEADDEGRADRDVRADLAPGRGCARAPWPRSRGASSRAAPWARRAGTGCRDRAAPAPRPSAG